MQQTREWGEGCSASSPGPYTSLSIISVHHLVLLLHTHTPPSYMSLSLCTHIQSLCSSIRISHVSIAPSIPVLGPLCTASNFLVAIHCGCESPLTCNHGQNFAVKLADFDSAMDVKKLQTSHSMLKQLYRNAPSGTPGYRPPEVSWVDCVNNF